METIAWQDANKNILMGKVEKVGERFYTVVLTGASYKRTNAKRIPLGTKFLVAKEVANTTWT